MLEISNLKVKFPEKTIEADFSIQQGHSIALMGESGSGKSTILNTIAGFEHPQSGDIVFNGKSMLNLAPAARPVTMLFQENNLFKHLNVMQNIGLGIHPGLKLSAQDKASIDHALEAVGLTGFNLREPTTLSGGQNQRVALARCLIRKQPLLLLDEPFKGLDQERKTGLMHLYKSIIDDQKITLVLATHNKREANTLCDQILMLDD